MSPSDLGELLEPFAFLDLFEHDGPPFFARARRRSRRSGSASCRRVVCDLRSAT
jgi:hypothetical protein